MEEFKKIRYFVLRTLAKPFRFPMAHVIGWYECQHLKRMVIQIAGDLCFFSLIKEVLWRILLAQNSGKDCFPH